MLRGVPHNASSLKKVYLPLNLMAEHGISTESVIRNNFDQDSFRSLVERMAATADEHLSNAKFRSKFLDKDERRLLLPAVTADRFMTRLNRAQCDVFNSHLLARDSWLPVLLYWHYLRGSY